jgi:outer membrane receptor for ferrienterochelin and colicins
MEKIMKTRFVTVIFTLLIILTVSVKAEETDLIIIDDEEDIETTVVEDEPAMIVDETDAEIVVTGTRTEKRVDEAPVKTAVINQETMERKNAANLGDAIDGSTGVRVENNCQNCGFNQVRLNGLDGNYSQILIDGKPVYSSLAGVYGLEHIPVQMIDRIEIVKGGGSALYGGNAIAGVINVITKRPDRNFANMTMETQLIPGDDSGLKKGLRLGADGGVVSKDNKAALFVYGGGLARQPWDANGDGFSELGEIRQNYAGSTAYLTLFKGGELEGKFNLMKDSRRGGDSFLRAKHKSEVTESVETDRWGGEIKWKHDIASTGTSYDMSYGFAYTERNSYYGGDDEFGDMYGKTKNPLHVWDVTANQLANFLGAMMFTAGIQYTLEDLDDYTADGSRAVEERYTNFGGIFQLDWVPVKWAEIVAGLRVDKHSELSKPIVSPRTALLLNHKNFKSRTSFSTGFRAPQIFDEDFHITIVQGEPSPTVNSDDLEAEKSWNLSQQFDYTYRKNGYTLKPAISGYFSQIKDAFNTKTIGEDDPLYKEGENTKIRYNSGTTTVMGIEVEFELAYKKLWSIDIGWTFENAKNSEADEDLQEIGIEEKRILRTPNYYGYIALEVTPWKGLEFDTALNLTGPMKIKHEGEFGDDEFRLHTSEWFYDWNISVGYRHEIGDGYYIKPYFAVRNVLNSFQSDFDEGAERDAGYIYGPRNPRMFLLGIRGGM